MTLQEFIDDPSILERLRQQTYDREAKLDDYYDQLGEIVEQYPIASAGIRRG